MSYQPITWRNVNAPSNAAANNLLDSAGRSLDQMFSKAGQAVKSIQEDGKAEYDHLVDKNTQAFLNAVRNHTNVDQLQAARPTLDQMITSFKGDVDFSKTRGAIDNQVKSLQEQTLAGINFDNRLATEREKPMLGASQKLLAAKKFPEFYESLKNLRPETAAPLVAQAKEAEKVYKEEYKQEQQDLNYEKLLTDAIINNSSMSDSQNMGKYIEDGMALGVPISRLIAGYGGLEQTLADLDSIAKGDQPAISMIESMVDQSFPGIKQTDAYQLQQGYEGTASENAVKIVDDYEDKLGEFYSGNRGDAINDITRVLNQGHEVSVQDSNGDSIKVRVTPALVRLAMAQTEGKILSFLSDGEMFSKKLSDTLVSAGLEQQFIDLQEYNKLMGESKKAVESDLKGRFAAYDSTKAVKAALLPKQEEQPKPIPKPLQPEPAPPAAAATQTEANEEVIKEVVRSRSGVRRPSRNKLRQEREAREAAQAKFESNPLVKEARSSLANALSFFERQMVKARFEKRFKEAGLDIGDL